MELENDVRWVNSYLMKNFIYRIFVFLKILIYSNWGEQKYNPDHTQIFFIKMFKKAENIFR